MITRSTENIFTEFELSITFPFGLTSLNETDGQINDSIPSCGPVKGGAHNKTEDLIRRLDIIPKAQLRQGQIAERYEPQTADNLSPGYIQLPVPLKLRPRDVTEIRLFIYLLIIIIIIIIIIISADDDVIRRRGYCNHFVTMYVDIWVSMLAR